MHPNFQIKKKKKNTDGGGTIPKLSKTFEAGLPKSTSFTEKMVSKKAH